MKIIGSGLIASAFLSTEFGKDVTLFASGVSNSKEESMGAYNREINLLKTYLNNSEKLIYFSTCSVKDPHLQNTLYVSHKISLEELVLSNKNNIVIRLPQVVGICKNPYTLTNFLAKKIYNEQVYDLLKGTIKNIIHIDDVVILTKHIFKNNLSESLYSFNMPIHFEISEIVYCLENILGKKSLHIDKKGHRFKYDDSLFISNAISDSIIDFDSNYLKKTLYKVYSNYPNGFQ